MVFRIPLNNLNTITIQTSILCMYNFDTNHLMKNMYLNSNHYARYIKVLIFLSSRFIYLFSISHSICSFIIFFGGMNIFLRISTSSVCSAAFVIRFLIFMIFTMASCDEDNVLSVSMVFIKLKGASHIKITNLFAVL